MNIAEKMKKDWDRRAKVDPLYWVEPTNWLDEKLLKKTAMEDTASLLHKLDRVLHKDACILDIGCGVGRMVDILSDFYKEIHGVDVSGEMIKEGTKRLAHKENIFLHETNGINLSLFEEDKFDFVYSFATLPHMPMELVHNYFVEISRILKKGAILKVQLWKGKPNYPDKSDTLTPRVMSENEFSRLCSDNGFELIATEKHDYEDPILKTCPIWCTLKNTKNAPEIKNFLKNITVNSTKMSKSEQTESDLLVYYGTSMINNGKFKKAKEALLNAIEINTKSIDAYNILASLFLEEGKIHDAVLLLKRAVKDNPDFKEGRKYLSELSKINDFKEISLEVKI